MDMNARSRQKMSRIVKPLLEQEVRGYCDVGKESGDGGSKR